LLIATPNIAVDRILRLPELRPGGVLRSSPAVVTAGGKGVNVGRTAAAFGRRATLVSFLPQADAALVARLMAAEPVAFAGVPVPGEARVATIYREDSGRVTVVNEPGPAVPADAWARYERAVADELATGRHATLVCSGSLPPGAPHDGYARLAALGRRAGARVLVDASRAALAEALPAAPDVVTPNLAEAEQVLYGRAHEGVAETGDDVPGRARRAALELCRRGARSAAVTAGAAGTAYGAAGEVVWVPTVPVRVANPIGAGDSFVAGLVEAFEAGRTGVAAVVFAVATATAAVEHERAGAVDPERARELAARLTGILPGA